MVRIMLLPAAKLGVVTLDVTSFRSGLDETSWFRFVAAGLLVEPWCQNVLGLEHATSIRS